MYRQFKKINVLTAMTFISKMRQIYNRLRADYHSLPPMNTLNTSISRDTALFGTTERAGTERAVQLQH